MPHGRNGERQKDCRIVDNGNIERGLNSSYQLSLLPSPHLAKFPRVERSWALLPCVITRKVAKPQERIAFGGF